MSDASPDLRSWLATLDAAGQLRRIVARVDWNEEIGAITRANLSLGGPALLFENIAGHEDTRCTKLLTSGIGSRRQIQLMLGLPEGTGDAAIVRHLKDAFRQPIPPRIVDTGPVKENMSRVRASTSGSFPRRNGMRRTAVGTSTRSVAWSPRTG